MKIEQYLKEGKYDEISGLLNKIKIAPMSEIQYELYTQYCHQIFLYYKPQIEENIRINTVDSLFRASSYLYLIPNIDSYSKYISENDRNIHGSLYNALQAIPLQARKTKVELFLKDPKLNIHLKPALSKMKDEIEKELAEQSGGSKKDFFNFFHHCY